MSNPRRTTRRAHTRRTKDGKVVQVRESKAAQNGTTTPPAAAATTDATAQQVVAAGQPDRPTGGLPRVSRDQSYAGMDLRSVDTLPAHAFNANFDGANLEGRSLPKIAQHCSFRDAKLRQTLAPEAQWSSDYSGADIAGGELGSGDGVKYVGAQLQMATTGRQVFIDCDFSGADLEGSEWYLTRFERCDFATAVNIDKARFKGCTFDDHTTFPEGYDPAGNGWTFLAEGQTLNDEERARLEQQIAQRREAAAAGTYDSQREAG